MKSFQAVFGDTPQATGHAPGRVNLLGDHTDYNDGFVLPIAIPQRTHVSLQRRAEKGFTLYAALFDRAVNFEFGEPPRERFAKYVYGALVEVRAEGFEIPPLNIHVSSTVPMGVGLSSSAALEVATLRALRNLLDLTFDDVRLAQIAQRAEVHHAGVHCGIMDQMASSLADTRQALFLDTRTLERRLIPLPEKSAILVLDSGVSRSLASTAYNERRAECEMAASRLGVQALRDVETDALWRTDALEEPWRSRARHVVSENARVLKAASQVGPVKFGALLNESHASLRDDFAVSVPALDQLVALLQAHSEVYGARLTGAGFGGACVALCPTAKLIAVAGEVLTDYARAGNRGGAVLVPPA